MTEIKAESDCVINYLCFKDGSTVGGGDEILQVEVMKMMIPYTTPEGGMIKYRVKQGDYVATGQVLAEIV
jgi:biotin carboxyl carrier protein